MDSTMLSLSQINVPHCRPSQQTDYPDINAYDLPHHPKMDLPQEEIDAIIRNRRKARDPKACYACHRRKVKCDRGMPCDSCVKRDHPELCSYERPTKKRRLAVPTSTSSADNSNHASTPIHGTRTLYEQQEVDTVTVPKEQWNRINNQLLDLQETLRNYQAGNLSDAAAEDDPPLAGTISRSDESEKGGIHAPSEQMGTMHLGSRSVLAYMVGLKRSKSHQDAAKTLLEENVLPNLGLDNETTTYPFVDLWSTHTSMHDMAGLVNALPGDETCMEFFRAYKDIACVIYPVVPDVAVFEATLLHVLANRARMGGDMSTIDPNKPFGVSTQWLALLFAVLASGSQSSCRLAKERELTSQVYICCSYQALRISNFLTHPNLDVIQAFLIIGNVLSYNMNPGVSYIILGMTMRLAFSMGLQTDSPAFSPEEQYFRNRIWWVLAWQDSHFSVSYDRPSASALCTPDIPYRKISTPGHRSYAESMFRIIKLTQEIIRERILNPRHTMSWSTIQSYEQEVTRIVADGAPHLRDRKLCTTNTQHLERLALRLHASYITSELCRPALKESATSNANRSSTGTPAQSPSDRRRKTSVASSNDSNSNITTQLRHDCLVNLEATIEAYVEVYGICQFAARSWIGIQRAVSAAFLLGTYSETNQDPHIQHLLRSLEHVIEHRAREDPSFYENHSELDASGNLRRSSSATQVPLAEPPQWARSMTKSLKALSKLNATLAAPNTSITPAPTSTPMGPYHSSQILPFPNSATQINYNNLSGIPGIVMPAVMSPSMGGSLTPGSGSGSGSGNLGNTGAAAGVSGTGSPYRPMMETYSPSTNPGTWSTNLHAPVTPDSSSSGGEWNVGNLGERTKEFVIQPLWG